MDYISILQSVLEYEKRALYSTCAIFFVALIVLTIRAVIRFKKEKLLDKIIICCIFVVFLGAFIGMLISSHQHQTALQTDIDTCSFITYHGQMVHEDYQRDSFYHTVTIDSEGMSSIKLQYPDYGNQYHLHDQGELMPLGITSGTVVYAEHSKIIVYWQGDQ